MDKKIGLVARLENKTMTMKMYTDQPRVQFYTGNFLGDGPNFKNEHRKSNTAAFV